MCILIHIYVERDTERTVALEGGLDMADEARGRRGEGGRRRGRRRRGEGVMEIVVDRTEEIVIGG